jgi:hypothetical protein
MKQIYNERIAGQARNDTVFQMKRIYLGILLGSILFSLNAQTVKEVFISFPESEMLLLSANARMDLVDLYLNNRPAVVNNNFEDSVSLVQMTDDYLKFESGNSTTEIILLHLVNESQIVCFIQTVCAPVCDSQLEFYTVSWKKLNSETFIHPVGVSGFIEENETLSVLDIPLMEFHYNPEKQRLIQTYNTPSYLSLEDKKIIEPYIKETEREYQWDGLKFEEINRPANK